MTMNAELADFYDTPGQDSEDLQKQASVESFAKLAAKHGIDLSSMGDEEVNALYAEVYPDFAKTAMEHDDDDDEDEEDDKKKSASYHFQEKVAFQEKFAEADFMGRVMAHSFTQEIDNIEKDAGKFNIGRMAKAMGDTKFSVGEKIRGVAGKVGRRVSHTVGEAKHRVGKAGRSYKEAVMGKGTGPSAERLRRAEKRVSGGNTSDAAKMQVGRAKKLHRREQAKRVAAIGAPVAAVAAGGGYAATREKKSSAQDFEELSANHAIKIAEAAGYDTEEAFDLVNSIFTLGLEETEKVAEVQDVDDAIHVRGLEYLEAGGYPVDWSEVFGD